MTKFWRRAWWLVFGWWARRQRRKRAAWPPYMLDVGRCYDIVHKPDIHDDLPLMPALTLAQAAATGRKMKRLAVGTQFKVLAQVKHPVHPLPWWKVLVTSGEHAGSVGLLNGVALLPAGKLRERRK